MAERGVHLTANLQNKPSIFEVVASDSLNAAFQPAIKHVFNILATANPDRFGPLYRHFDEIFLVLNGFIQQYYIRLYGGTLSEVFYGLKNVSTKTNSLGNYGKCVLFSCIVVGPYIWSKIDSYLKLEDAEDENDKTVRLKKWLGNFVFGTKAFYDCLQMFQFIGYMANAVSTHSVIKRLFQLRLEYSDDVEIHDFSFADIFKGHLMKTGTLAGIIFRALELSVFFLQFVKWWQTEKHEKGFTNLPTPHPPIRHRDYIRFISKCPICLQKWKIPTVISVTGYIYCYSCIMNHFNNRSLTCAVTHCPASVEDLVRIYDT